MDRGFVYDSSLLDGDVPYRFSSADGTGSLVEIPVDWALDDWEQYAFYPGWTGSGVIESPARRATCGCSRPRHSMPEGGCFVLTNHPFISGRPSKAVALEQLIEDVRALDGMWVTTLGEIARHTEQVVTEVTEIRRVEAPTEYFDSPDLPRAVS